MVRKDLFIMENIFMETMKPLTLEEYLTYDENTRGNLGNELPVLVYRLLEYSLKDELIQRYGKDTQIDIFRKAGRKAGEYFAEHMLNLDLPLDTFISELQKKLEELIDEIEGTAYKNRMDRL